MKQTVIPNSLKRRDFIEQEMSDAESLAFADAYMEDGRIQEGIVFLSKANATDRLEALAEQAVGEGDAFLLKEVGQVLGRDFSSDRWLKLAEAAEKAGKTIYSETARRQARVGDAEY